MARNTDVNSVVEYFKGREEVSALYIFGIRRGLLNPERELGVGVLVDDAVSSHDRGGFLDMGSWDITEDFPQWAVNVVLLNDAPSFVRYHIARKGSVVFERDLLQRVRFTQRALDQYLDDYRRASSPAEEAAELMETELFKMP